MLSYQRPTTLISPLCFALTRLSHKNITPSHHLGTAGSIVCFKVQGHRSGPATVKDAGSLGVVRVAFPLRRVATEQIEVMSCT